MVFHSYQNKHISQNACFASHKSCDQKPDVATGKNDKDDDRK